MKWIFILALLNIPQLLSAGIVVDTNYTTVKHFNEKDWQKFTEDHEYEAGKNISTGKRRPFDFPAWIRYFFYAVLTALLAFIIYKLAITFTSPANRKLNPATVQHFAEEEEHASFDYTDLEKKLATAIQNSDYRNAIRLSFLIAIRELSVAGLIIAARDKTNYEYLRELKSHPVTGLFSDITLTFEKTWYGEINSSPEEYSTFEDKFTKLRLLINNSVAE